jgi:hypothetical protein
VTDTAKREERAPASPAVASQWGTAKREERAASLTQPLARGASNEPRTRQLYRAIASRGTKARGVARVPRPRTYFSEHRRRYVLAILRRWERLAWIAAALVIVATSAFAVRAVLAGFGQAQVTARFHPAAMAPSGESPPCILTGCTRPTLVGSPTRVRIPAIGVDTGLEDLTLNTTGQLNAPVSYDQAGWYSDGVLPGDSGPAVIAGHVDSVSGPAVFYRLHELVAGDTVAVLRGGVWVSFRVITVEQYAKDQFPNERVYRPTPDAELRLITCGGEFDRRQLSYQDNIVVYAVIE